MDNWWDFSDWFTTLGIVLATFIGVTTLILEMLEIIFLLTPSEKDDKWLAKVRTKWLAVKPFLEWFHIRTPLAKILAKLVSGLQLIKGIIIRYKQSKE